MRGLPLIWLSLVTLMLCGLTEAEAPPATTARAATPSTFHSETYGYSLQVPMDWHVIPKEQIQSMFSEVLNPKPPATPIIYDAALEPSANPRPFVYPYMLVQIIPYGTPGASTQIREDEVETVVKQMTGANLSEAGDASGSKEVRESLSNSSVGEASLDRGKHRYKALLHMTVAGIGKVNGMLTGYFGREALVQVCFYSTEADWQKSVDAGQAIADSFRFDGAKAFDVALASTQTPPRSIGSGVWENTLSGAAAGGLFAGIAYIVSKFKKKKDKVA